jgi:hypothetical protein
MVFFSIVCNISTCDIPTRIFCAIFLHEFFVRYSYTNFLCNIPTQIFCAIFLHKFSVRYSYKNYLCDIPKCAELQHFFAAPALGNNVDAALASVDPAPTLTLLCSKPTF